LVCDSAGWHQRRKRLRVPDNITLLRLPAYSPELNPMENIWDYLRGNKLSSVCGTAARRLSPPVGTPGIFWSAIRVGSQRSRIEIAYASIFWRLVLDRFRSAGTGAVMPTTEARRRAGLWPVLSPTICPHP
jgi:hypothetical protein